MIKKNNMLNCAKIAILFMGLLIIYSQILPVHAEPYLAVRTGFKCSQCHVNQTGGGKRTNFGLIYSQTNLNLNLIRPNKPSFFDGKLSEFISIGANFRANDVSIFGYENSRGEKIEFNNNSTRISEANLYFQVDVVPDVLTVYVDQTLEPNANREFFGLWQNLPMSSYLKIGRMLLPFGYRLLDDEAFVRNWTGYTYNRHDTAIEFGLEPKSISFAANLTENQLSLLGSTVFRRFRIGGSFGRNIKHSKDFVWGVFAGLNFGRLTLLGEGDFITIGDIDRFAGIGELNLLLKRGLNFKAVYEFFDRNMDVSNAQDGQERITLGIEPFLTRFMQLGIFYRINRFIPQNLSQNRDQLTLQFHFFF